MKKLTAISVFTGAMGLDLGVEKAGFEIKAAVELDKNACEAIRLNRPELPLFAKNINFVSGAELLSAGKIKKGQLDLFVGGPPCQSFSTAGRRRSLTDAKGDCIFQYIRLLEELEPTTFIMENVRGILSSTVQLDGLEILNNEGIKETINYDYPVHEFIIKRMIELGYNVEYRLLNSADYGVPQKRHRVFFIGTKLDKELEFPTPTHYKDAKDGQNRWITFADVLSQLKKLGIEKHHFNEYTKDRKKYMEMIPKNGGNWRDLPPQLTEVAMGTAYHSGGGKVGFFRRIKLNEPAPTLLTSPTHKSTMLGHPLENRPLSIEEYMAIQQFPMDWKLPSSLSAQYMIIGNAVPVMLAYSIANEIAKHIRKKNNEDVGYTMIDVLDLENKISELLDNFYTRRMEKINGLQLKNTLKRKNPYLYKSIGTQKASEIVEGLLSAYMSSSDEGIFGDSFFEPLAKFASGGVVSPSEGVDVAVETDNVYTAIAVKSGTNVFNAQSKRRQITEFKTLESRLKKLQKQFDPLVGYCYGRKQVRKDSVKDFRELAGQAFWEEITGDSDFYLKIIRLMKDKPQIHAVEFKKSWDAAVNRFTAEFITTFCFNDGNIDWEKLTEFNSAAPVVKEPKVKKTNSKKSK